MAVIKRRPAPKSTDNKGRKPKDAEKEYQNNEIEISREEMEGMEQEILQQQEEFNQESEKDLIEEIEDEVMINTNQDKVIEYSLEDFKSSTSKTIPKITTEAGAMSVINSKNGKRVPFSKDVMNELNNPESVSISFSDESLAVAERLPNNNNQLKVKNIGNKGVIYSAGLVSEITDKYGLDFSNRTSITFSEVNYIENNGCTVAIIKIK